MGGEAGGCAYFEYTTSGASQWSVIDVAVVSARNPSTRDSIFSGKGVLNANLTPTLCSQYRDECTHSNPLQCDSILHTPHMSTVSGWNSTRTKFTSCQFHSIKPIAKSHQKSENMQSNTILPILPSIHPIHPSQPSTEIPSDRIT